MTAKFLVYRFDRHAKELPLMSVATEWPDDADVDVVRVVDSLSILYPRAAGVRVDFAVNSPFTQVENV